MRTIYKIVAIIITIVVFITFYLNYNHKGVSANGNMLAASMAKSAASDSNIDIVANESPNQSEITKEFIPKGIVIHSMAEYVITDNGALYAKDFLKSINLSVHGFIKTDGTFDKMKESNIKASHAGKSYHKPYSGLNSYYIGVEVLVKGEHNYETFLKAIGTKGTYSEEQFQGCIKQCKLWMKEYNIPIDRIVRHSDVSGDNIRGKGHGKPDPGTAFDWDRFIKELGKE